eukprot:13081154-Alexandrium_andersonii.AAC.1
MRILRPADNNHVADGLKNCLPKGRSLSGGQNRNRPPQSDLGEDRRLHLRSQRADHAVGGRFSRLNVE